MALAVQFYTQARRQLRAPEACLAVAGASQPIRATDFVRPAMMRSLGLDIAYN
jgi:hypothetical protein